MHAILPERFSKALSWVFGAGLYIVVNCQLLVKLNSSITDEKRNLPILFVTIITQTNLRIYTWLIKSIWSQLYIDWERSQNARLLHFKLSTFKHVYIDLDGEWNLSYQNEQCVDLSNEKFTSERWHVWAILHGVPNKDCRSVWYPTECGISSWPVLFPAYVWCRCNVSTSNDFANDL